MITGAETAHLSPKTPAIYLEGKLPLVIEKTAAELGLRDGQVVQGTIESKINALRLILQGPQPGQSGAYIDLPKDLPAGLRLATGDTALFRVQVLANGSLLLRPLQAAPAAALPVPPAPAALPGRTEQLGFRPPDMQALAQLLRPGVLDSMLQGLSASAPELGALQQWLKQRTSMAQLTPEKLQQAMQRSGFMTENMLTQGLGGGLVDRSNNSLKQSGLSKLGKGISDAKSSWTVSYGSD